MPQHVGTAVGSTGTRCARCRLQGRAALEEGAGVRTRDCRMGRARRTVKATRGHGGGGPADIRQMSQPGTDDWISGRQGGAQLGPEVSFAGFFGIKSSFVEGKEQLNKGF